jgi:hypothetical protein
MKSVILAAGLCALTMTGKGQQPAEVPGSHVLSGPWAFAVRDEQVTPLGLLNNWVGDEARD